MSKATIPMRWGALALVGAMALAACGGSTGATSAPAASDHDAASMAPEPAETPASATASPASSAQATPDAPATAEPAMSPAMNAAAAALAGKDWATATLTDVDTGEEFTIADLAGKPVFVETMAIWCSNCRAQQGRFTEALGRLPAGAAEYVVLTIDPSETAEDLARYKADRGFAGRYVVAGKAMSKALQAEFGTNALNPPSVPLVFISPSGEVTFSTGSESVDEIVAKAGA